MVILQLMTLVLKQATTRHHFISLLVVIGCNSRKVKKLNQLTIVWDQNRNIREPVGNTNKLSRDVAIVHFGAQKIRLTNLFSQSVDELGKSNFIQVDIEGDCPTAPLKRLCDMLDSVCGHTVKMLNFSVFIPLTQPTMQDSLVTTASNFLSLKALNAAMSAKVAVKDSNTMVLYQFNEVPLSLKVWSPNGELLTSYGVFGSYRWDKPDQSFVLKMCEHVVLF